MRLRLLLAQYFLIAFGCAEAEHQPANPVDAPVIPDAASPDTAPPAACTGEGWEGRPPATPLIVRNPYVNVWQASDHLAGSWPSLWDGHIKAITGIARIDDTAFVFMGSPSGVTAAPLPQTKLVVSPTRSIFEFEGAGIQLTVEFLSPVEPRDLKRQSMPLGYIFASARSQDGTPHRVKLYFDISGEWAHGDPAAQIQWARELVPSASADVAALSFSPAAPVTLNEVNQYPEWGTAFLAARTGSDVAVQIGADTAVRGGFATSGMLDGTIDAQMPRAISDRWPVAAVSFNLGTVDGGSGAPRVVALGQARDPAVTYHGAPLPPLWRAYWPTWQAMVAEALDDARDARERAKCLDDRIMGDAQGVGGPHYAALVALALRQTLGGTELAGTASSPRAFLKEISSCGCMQTVDVIYPAAPALLYLDPNLLQLLLEPLIEYAESGLWPQPFSEHDLGSYPRADGHDDGREEDMPLEESANMLIMVAALLARLPADQAHAYAVAHYRILKQWADYVEPITLEPGNQLTTDDFNGFITNSVNLAVKGIISLGAMAQIATAAGQSADANHYQMQAQSFIAQWTMRAQDPSGNHLMLTYGGTDTWALIYNAFFDRALGLDLIAAPVMQREADWYRQKMTPLGAPLDVRNANTKTDWELWAAAAIDDPAVRAAFIDGVYRFVTTSGSRVPFTDLYDTSSGLQPSIRFEARPVVGGVFSILLREHKGL